jgi:uncharacterized protein (PEP-CTERM system associated)
MSKLTESYRMNWNTTPRFFLLVLMTATPNLSVAAKWVIEPLLDIQEVYTDNVLLAPSGLEDDDFITVITPAVSVGSENNRLDFQLNYSMQNIIYAGDSDRNQQFHLLSTNNTAKILKDLFFLEFSLNRSTKNINNTGNVTSDNLNITSDRGVVLSYVISPYWKQRVGSLLDMELRYTRDKIDSSKTFGSNSDNIEINITSGPDFSRFLFGINFENRKIQNNSLTSTRTRNINGNVKYLLSRKFAVVTEIGYDDNEFESRRNSINGDFWNVGIEWNPSVRTSFGANYGQRFFGDDLQVFFSHRSRRTQTSIRFEKAPSTTRASLLQQQAFILTDLFDYPLDDPASRQIADLNLGIPQQTNEVLIRSNLTLAFVYKLKKNTINISANYSESEYEISRDTEYGRNINLSWIWNMFPRTKSNVSVEWSKNNFRTARDDTYVVVQYNLSHIISANFTGNIGLRFLDRKSNSPLLEYNESRIFANISKQF